jgi:hypothetical protein
MRRWFNNFREEGGSEGIFDFRFSIFDWGTRKMIFALSIVGFGLAASAFGWVMYKSGYYAGRRDEVACKPVPTNLLFDFQFRRGASRTGASSTGHNINGKPRIKL